MTGKRQKNWEIIAVNQLDTIKLFLNGNNLLTLQKIRTTFNSNFMKRLFFISLLIAITMATSAQTTLRFDKPTYSISGNKPVATFNVTIPADGSYYTAAWVMGVKHADGTYSSYTLQVDNTYYTYTVSTSGADWGYSYLMPLYLSHGSHQLHIYSNSLDDVPNVESLYMCSVPIPPSDADYVNMKAHTQDTPSVGTGYQKNFHFSGSGTSTYPPVTFLAQRDKELYYTFHRIEYYTAGQTVNAYLDILNTEGSHVVFDIFPLDGNITDGNTWTETDFVAADISESGFYYLMVRTDNNGEWGTCSFDINGNRYFEDVPVNCCKATLTSDFETADYQCFVKGDSVDPMSLVFSSDGTIVGFCDDGGYDPTVSDIDWAANSRVLTEMGAGFSHFATLANSLPADSHTAVADMYTGLRNGYTPYSYGLETLYPNYKKADLMASAGYSDNYHSLAWALGNWSDTRVFYNYSKESVLSVFDTYASLLGFSRTGATEENAVIDLYTIGEYISHAAVKSKGHYYAAGYAWESKLDVYPYTQFYPYIQNVLNLERVFHPRYALEGDAAGMVAYHYRKSSDTTEAVIPCDVISIENVELTAEEQQVIESRVSSVPADILRRFRDLANACSEEGRWMLFVCLDRYETLESYSKLLDLCRKEPSAMNIVCDMAGKADPLGVKLLHDLTIREYGHIWNAIAENNGLNLYTRDGKYISRSALTEGVQFVKAYLNGGQTKKALSGISYSSDPMFTVGKSGRTLTITFDLEDEAQVSVGYGDPKRGMVESVSRGMHLYSGRQQTVFDVPQEGIYVITVTINGSIYTKKVVVE